LEVSCDRGGQLLHDRALFQFWEQKLPVNGYSNARK